MLVKSLVFSSTDGSLRDLGIDILSWLACRLSLHLRLSSSLLKMSLHSKLLKYFVVS